MQWGDLVQSVEHQRFETMTMPHVNALFQTALRLTEDRTGAEEVVHEAYACASKSFDGREERTGWRLGLFKILIARIHRRNRGWFDRTWSAELDQTGEEPSDPDTASYAPEQVVSALTKVPLAFREIILLVDCQGFSYKEAAEILGLSTETVADRLILGRRRLRSELAATISIAAVS